MSKFEYENNNRLTGKLKEASWLINQSAWSLCPIRPAKDPTINNFINQLNFSDLRQPIDISTLGSNVWEWMNKCKALYIRGFDFEHTTFATGIDNFIDSLILRSDNISCLSNTYYFEHDICDYYNKNYYTLDKEIKPNTTVVIEFPTPHHNINDMKYILKDPKKFFSSFFFGGENSQGKKSKTLKDFRGIQLTFKRRIMKLKEGKFINTEKTSGKEGNSTLLFYSAEKKLTDFYIK